MRPDWRPWRVEALFGLGTIELLLDEDSPALVEARDLALQLGLLIKVSQADMLLADHRLVVDGPTGIDASARRLIENGELLQLGFFGYVGRQLLAAQLALAGEPRAAEEQLRQLAAVAHLPPDTLGQAQSVRAYAALAAHDVDSAVAHLDNGLRPLLSHGSTAPLADFGLWVVVSAARRGDRDPVRTELRAHPVLLRRANRGALAYAGAIVAGRRKEADAAAKLFAVGSELLAATPWWARFLRLITLESAIADGWGDPPVADLTLAGIPIAVLGLGQELADPTGELVARYGLDGAGCVLVRPDGYIGWMSGAESTPGDLSGAILAVTGPDPIELVA